MALTDTSETLLQSLVDELDVPLSRYEATDRSYRSLAQWLERSGSRFHDVDIDVYVQGSFRLGTVIRPVDEDEHYDLDVVCEFSVSKTSRTQRQLHADMGYELRAYANRYGMDEPSPWDRCWTLNYADGAQFHMDVLPCVPDAVQQQKLRKLHAFAMDFVENLSR
jgi:Second Messenger Oligonucleotide or Dinucleotide Synthetase domain